MNNKSSTNLKVCKEDYLDKYIGEICNNEYMFFLDKINVVGIALGYKYINNICSNEKCIAVLVKKKISSNLLCAKDVIPKLYKGIKTDVIETGEFIPLSLKDRVRPVTGGYSVGNVLDPFSGTMGCLVKDDNSIYMLSNNHVLVDYNRFPIGSSICQPGIDDGGKPSTDVVANLSKYVPIKFKTKTTFPENFVDCAIAEATNTTILSSYITFVGVPQGIIIPRIGVGVKKVGKITGLTSGIIQELHATLTMKVPSYGDILYKELILTSVIASGGDSGALLLDVNNYAVGLLIGKYPVTNYTAYCPIKTVLDALDVTLVTN